MKNKNNYAFANLAGVVIWSDSYKQKNGKYIHKYIVCVEENFEGSVWKHNFHVTSFNEESSRPHYRKDDLLKVNGFLKVNSFKDSNDEWKNEVWIQAIKIECLNL